MSRDSTIALISFILIFTLKYLFPFSKNPGYRIKHSLNNLRIAAINRMIILAGITYLLYG